MAVAITRPHGVMGSDFVVGKKQVRVRELVFSGNYATGGEPLTPRDVGLKKIEMVRFSGPARASDGGTSVNVGYAYSNEKLLFYESGASGDAMVEKTNAEAYPTGCQTRAEFIGVGGI